MRVNIPPPEFPVLDIRIIPSDTAPVASIELQNVSKVFRRGEDNPLCAVDDISFTVENGEFVAVVGPSGCGKTTTLRMIAGLETPTAGTIGIGGESVEKLRPEQRDVAMVFQRDALLPHLSAFENIELGLRLRRVPSSEARSRIDETVQLLGLKRFLARKPHELSGGERQRVALARAMVRRPKVFLFDEPLASLDAQLRVQLRIELARIHHHLSATMLYVTHDQAEALALGQRVAVMRNGAIEQIAPPSALYQTPAKAFVAGFVGAPPMNLLRGRIIRKSEQFWFVEHNVTGTNSARRLELPIDPARGERLALISDGNVIIGFRPERVRLAPDPRAVANVEVELIEPLGDFLLVHLGTGANRFLASVKTTAARRCDVIGVTIDLSHAVFFNPVSEKPILLAAPSSS